MVAAVPSEVPSTEARQLGMVAHLIGLGNFAFGLAGIIGTIIVYVTAKDDFVRRNARAALNMQITWLLYSAVLIAAYFLAFVPMFLTFTATPHTSNFAPNVPLFGAMFAIMGLMFGGIFVIAIFNGLAARAAYLGRVFRYPIAIPFLRDPEFSETPLTT